MKRGNAFMNLALLAALSLPAWAVQPDEMLKDPQLESRARSLSSGFRCLVCQNESIDESSADLAKDLRILIRERLVKGDSDEQVTNFVVDRYGDYVLLKPRFNGSTAVLWLLPFAAVAGGAVFLFRRRKVAAAAAETPLSDAEKRRLKNI
jgi:cytochrome c-type biogenesis protein CcmH